MPMLEERHVCAHHRLSQADFTSPGAEAHYPPDLGVEPFHLDIELRLDLEARAASGVVTIRVRGRRPGADALELDAVDFEDLSVEGDRGLRHQYDGKKLRVSWSEGFERDEERALVVRYRVVEPVSGLFFSKPSAAYPDAAWYAATDHETERARHWLPCVDLPSVRTELDFHLRAEARFEILANGELIAEEAHEDGTKTAHWRLSWPCPSYLVCFAIGDFTRFDDGEFEGIPLAYFCSREHSPEDLERAFGRTGEMLGWMTQKLDFPFPYPKYFQFALPDFGGAMENISLVSWSDIFVLDEVLAREWTWLVDQVNVHEMAHSYFGDAVVCRDFAHAWLKESWATYMETCWLEDMRGADEQRYDIFSNAYAYFEEADGSYKRPVVTRTFNTSWNMYDRHLYPGGACRLHTLRSLLGDEVFWEAVRDYLKTWAGRVVETEDFRRIMELHSGRSLVRFFDQWFYSPGYPALKVSFAYDAGRGEGTFEIEQTQVDEKEGVPVFALELELGWVIDGELRCQPVSVDKARHTFVIAMGADPAQVRVDPKGKVLRKLDFNPGDDKLRAQLVGASDVEGRILAAMELAATGKRANLLAIRDAYTAEPFWGVRVRMARALTKARTDAAIDHLVELLGQEQDPMVLEHFIRALGGLRDGRVRAALESRIDAGLPYRAHQAALEGLGLQRGDAPVERLAKAAQTAGFGGLAQSGALRGLAYSRRPEVLETLMAMTAPGASPMRARGAAVTALGILGGALDEVRQAPVVERLVDLLRDPNDRIRWSAGLALSGLKAAAAIPALAAWRDGALPAQEKVPVDRWIAAIRKGEDPRVPALEKQLEEANGLIRKLGARLEKIEARLEAADKKPADEGGAVDKKTADEGGAVDKAE